MKATFIRERLLKVASLVGQVVTQRPNLPVLGNLLISVQKGAVEITATDLETTISAKVPAKVEVEGETTLSARQFIDFLQATEQEQILLTTDKETAEVSTESAKAQLPTISQTEFPSVGQPEANKPVGFDREKLLASINEVTLVAAPEEGRPVLTGVLFTSSGGKMVLVATDGYRLAKKETPFKGTLDAVIPAKALRGAAKAMADQEDDEVEISVDKEKTQARLSTKNLSVTTRLIEGDYPGYEQIIPPSFVSEVGVSTKGLADAIKLAALFARDVGNVVRLEIGKGKMVVNASTASVGEAQATLNIQHKGEELKTAFNSRFLLDALSTIKGNEALLHFSGPTSAILLQGKNDPSLVHVIMPVRTAG